MTKKQAYEKLVAKRKADNYTAQFKYRNQSHYPKYDSNEIGNYSMWANDLDADLMVIAQDYCDRETFEKCRGLIQSKVMNNPEDGSNWETKTNYYLWKLLKSIGRDIGLPYAPKKAGVFLTNAILDLKKGDMSEKVSKEVSAYSGPTYLQPLVDIIQPSKIIALGMGATKSILRLYASPENDYKKRAGMNMQELFRMGSFEIRNGKTKVHPMFHPGVLGQNGRKQMEEGSERDRFEIMMEDWKKLA